MASETGPGILSLQGLETPSPLSDANAIFLAKDKAVLQELENMQDTIGKMGAAGLKTVRVSDGLIAAHSYYEIEYPLVQSGKKENFTDVYKKISELDRIISLAYEAKDEIVALEKHLGEAKDSIDPAPVEALLASAKRELNAERFETAKESANAGEDKIVELQSLDTKAKAAAEAATANVFSFLDTNKFTILGAGGVLLVFFLIFKNRLKRYMAISRINALELERNTLRDEIRRAQDEFFVKGSIPDSIYKIRIKVYNAMVRDITRKIAVSTEALQKSEFKGFFKKKSPDPRSLSNMGEGKV
ncbi:MAG: hypothetical protein IPJ89_00485 [Candidatus Iainarchaeum archaeon]|uniref:Uncharacterized protein n=1 Tax=Candidatus Iainarchaeum sp. TaxID=3101447 RepID=A0A7T9I1U5_9ARCH|nr:MAG: hypothetical protein IPJ89_00485 [Candidatus Diapherotrites archaeon]